MFRRLLRNNHHQRRGASLSKLLTSQVALCNIPVLVLVLVASLDNADKCLLGSSFPLLEKILHLSVETLGYFSLFTNLSYALSLPLWGWLVHRHGMAQIHRVLAVACAWWGAATIGIALSGRHIAGQALFRALNGFALGSILPLSQTMLVGMVSTDMRGRAFGYMGMCEKLAGTLAAASVIYFENWQNPYYVLGFLSLGMAVVARHELTPGKRQQAKERKRRLVAGAKNTDSDIEDGNDDDSEQQQDEETHQPKLTVRQILERIVRMPAFLCLVAQGVFGGTPWDMMSFMLLLLDWRQFSKEQIVAIQFSTGISSTIGGWMGGVLGDYAASRFHSQGRIVVALISVLGGIPLYGMFLFSTNYHAALFYTNLFSLIATWPTAGALRPICAQLARNPSERAQIVSLWIVLEKTSGAIFGAPLVGYLTSHMVGMQKEGTTDQVEMEQKASALAWNLFGLSAFFWAACAAFWVGMACTIEDMAFSKHLRKNSDVVI